MSKELEELKAVPEVKALIDALRKSISNYESLKLTTGWHDLEYRRNVKALKAFKDE